MDFPLGRLERRGGQGNLRSANTHADVYSDLCFVGIFTGNGDWRVCAGKNDPETLNIILCV